MFRKMAALLVALAPVATLAFGLPKAPSAGGGGGLTGAMIDSFVEKAVNADAAMSVTSLALFEAVASKEERQAFEAEMAAAQAIADPKEKEAQVKKVKASAGATLEKADWEGAVAARISQLSTEQAQAMGAAAVKFLEAAGNNVGLVRQGQEMAKQKPEMTAASKMPLLTASVGNLVSQVKSATSVASSLAKLSKSGKVKLPEEATASIGKLMEGP